MPSLEGEGGGLGWGSPGSGTYSLTPHRARGNVPEEAQGAPQGALFGEHREEP